MDLLNNIQNIQGSAFDDMLIGDSHNNNLQGRTGNDTLDGGAGDDTLNGGPGVNTASYEDATAAVHVSLLTQGVAQNTGGAGTDTLISIQNLTGSDFSDTLTGDGNNNLLIGGAMEDKLYGGAGDDTLDGGPGGDILNGGAGIDTATYDDALGGVSVNLTITTAQNTGGSGFDGLVNIENLIGSPFDDSLTGSGAANVLTGGDGDDTIIGGGGDDVLYGGSGKDQIKGGNGADTIVGGGGSDQLFGGAGADHFVYTSIADSLPSNPDQIRDFETGVDKIDLSQIDADTTTPGDQAFHIVSAFTDNPGELVLQNHGSFFLVEGDVNGDGNQDLQIYVVTKVMATGDLIL
jgi:Ca2+-binding RTX toxin-like protein